MDYLKMDKFIVAFVLLSVLTQDTKSVGVAPLLKLNDGRDIPSLGLGTWLGFTNKKQRVPVVDESVRLAVEHAIDVGYRHIDTAAIYETEEQVGKAINNKIAEGVIKREDIFLTTKLWNTHHAKEAVIPALRESLQKLNLNYVDLYLVHWPVAQAADGSLENIDYVDTWKGMIEARDLGLAKSIGVSNFNQAMLKRLAALSPVKPASLQVEINLNLQQPSLLGYCRQQDILVTGYTPFGSLLPSKASPDAPPPRIDHPDLVKIADNHNKTTTQVNLRYLVELGVIPIPKSVTNSRIEQNLAVFDFSLTPEEKEVLKGFDRNYRTVDPKWWKDSPYYPF